jgi:hypothetical protein
VGSLDIKDSTELWYKNSEIRMIARGGKDDMEKLKKLRSEYLMIQTSKILLKNIEYYMIIWFMMTTKYNYGMIYVDCIVISTAVCHYRVMEHVIYVLLDHLRITIRFSILY